MLASLLPPPLRFAALLLLLFMPLALAVDNDPGSEADDSPVGVFVILLFLCVVFVLIGIGMVLAALAVLSLGLLAALGIVSSSAYVGFYHRRFSSGFRALHYQACALLGIPGGVGLLVVGARLFRADLPVSEILFIGALAGIGAGVALAFVLDRLATLSYQHLVRPALDKIGDRL
ncbi:hypothetical protein BH09VER1_BH09VER1_43900 [soil metagenome]